MSKLKGEATLLFSFIAPYLMGGHLLKERIYTSSSKYISLDIDHLVYHWEGFQTGSHKGCLHFKPKENTSFWQILNFGDNGSQEKLCESMTPPT